MAFLEMGGWALNEALRHSTEAARLVMGAFAFGQLIGGAVGIATATIRNHSATMLRRIGGRALVHAGTGLPVYFDPQYRCEMELLRFDSASYAIRYRRRVEELRSHLQSAPVLCASLADMPKCTASAVSQSLAA
jgi:hypothetical protein